MTRRLFGVLRLFDMQCHHVAAHQACWDVLPRGLSKHQRTHRRTCCTAASPSRRCSADLRAQGSAWVPSYRSVWVGGIPLCHHPHFGSRELVDVQVLQGGAHCSFKDPASDRLHTCSAHAQLSSYSWPIRYEWHQVTFCVGCPPALCSGQITSS